MKRYKFCKSIIVLVVVAGGSLYLAFPAQALLSDGRCIRFFQLPLAKSITVVPGYFPLVFGVCFLLSIVGATVLFLISLKYSPGSTR